MKRLLMTLGTLFGTIGYVMAEYSGRGVDYEPDMTDINDVPHIFLTALIAAAVGGALAYLGSQLNKDSSDKLGCLSMIGLIILVLAVLAGIYAAWKVVSVYVLTPILYFIGYILQLVLVLVVVLLAILIIPSFLCLLYSYIESLLFNTENANKAVMTVVFLIGLGLDFYVYQSLPDKWKPKDIFPEWNISEEMDKSMHPEKYYDE